MKHIVLILSLLFCVDYTRAANHLIQNGEILNEHIIAENWHTDDGAVSASGTGNYLTCNTVIAQGDFTIKAKLSLEEVKGTAASFMLGSNHFGFDGHGQKFFLEGHEFPKKSLGSNVGIIEAGKPFMLTITRSGGQLSASIDSQLIITLPFHANEIASFGFRPHRSTMHITDLSIDGKLLKLPELDYVFACDDDGYKSYRIPSVIKTKRGTLLASCEGRVNGSGDAGNIDLVLKRSTDHGKTWSDIIMIRDIEQTAGNPCPVVDQDTGRIVMVFCEMDHHEHHIMQGKSKRRVFTTYSDDDGLTWSEPANITDSVNPDGVYNWLASGPGIGIQVQKGSHKGRMVVPFANSIHHSYGVHTIYSDDGGETWKPSNLIQGGCNESQLVELSDGRLMLNMRMQQHGKGYRGLSYSNDSGATWSGMVHDDELNDPTCQASIISHESNNGSYLIFSNPATGGRNGMTIRVSGDNGETWPAKKLIYPRSSGYSNVVITDDDHVLCLFEGGPANYSQSGIASVRIPLAELLSGVTSTALSAEQARSKPSLLPAPQSIQWSGERIPLNSAKIVLPTTEAEPLKHAQLTSELKALLQRNRVSISPDARMQIVFRLGEVEAPLQWDGQGDEAYQLNAEKRGVAITANTMNGLYYGLQTLRQLMVHKEGQTTVAECSITDYPAFRIRGFMHDVGRNFQTLEQLKMQIDIMAMYKLNVFHWHLTEYFGWRLESKRYPDLQDDASFGRDVGEYYTQQEFKEMSDYCWARGITIIPEFDSPGHSDAFRKGVGIDDMKDPKAIKAMTDLIGELCTLADSERMPYIHIGTDEVRHKEEHVNADYLPALHRAVHDNEREVIGWWKGMNVKGDTKQIQQTWAQYNPLGNLRHIDSRSNYVNHLEALDFATRMLFQQPCRVPYGDARNLGGILAHWPDTRVEDEKLTLTNNPVVPAMVGYSEAVWTGVKKDRPEYWACVPPKGTPQYEAFADFEKRIAEQRDRFLSDKPFPMVKTHQIEWRLLGPVAEGEIPELDQGIVKDLYQIGDQPYDWTDPVYGAAIHARHFFNFSRHLNHQPQGKDIVWGNTHIHSPIDQEVDAWIGFNTISSSDDRAGSPSGDNWGTHPANNIWINGERIAPPKWKTDGTRGKEVPLVDQVYSSREPSKIQLKQGWNTVLVRSARKFKWVFSFSPITWDGHTAREVEGLRYSATN